VKRTPTKCIVLPILLMVVGVALMAWVASFVLATCNRENRALKARLESALARPDCEECEDCSERVRSWTELYKVCEGWKKYAGGCAEEAEHWKELAENCVHEKVMVKTK